MANRGPLVRLTDKEENVASVCTCMYVETSGNKKSHSNSKHADRDLEMRGKKAQLRGWRESLYYKLGISLAIIISSKSIISSYLLNRRKNSKTTSFYSRTDQENNRQIADK